MRKLLSILGVTLAVAMPAQAQTVTETGGTVKFELADNSYNLCQNNQLNEEAYARILNSYMNNAVQNDLTPKYMEVYENQNERLQGQLDQVVARQQQGMTEDQMNVLYGPFRDSLSEEQFFKMHILNATSISTLLAQNLGPEKAQRLCQSG